MLDTIDEGVRWKKRHTRDLHEDERKLPFPRDIVGTFSCHGVEPVYEVFEGWEDPADRPADREALPEAARRYLDRIEAFIGVPIEIVSIGPERSEVLVAG